MQPDATTPAPPTPPAPRTVGALLAALATGLHLGALGNGYVIDDHAVIEAHPVVTGAVSWTRVFEYDAFGVARGTPGMVGAWRPLQTLLFAVERAVFGPSPAVVHAINALLHGAVTAMVFALTLGAGAGLRVAALAGALFAVHTLHTDAVYAGVGQAELTSALFALAALALHTRDDGRSRVGAALAFAAALLSKESAVLLLPTLVAHDLVMRRPRSFVLYARHAVYAATFAAVLAARAYTCGGVQGFLDDAVMNPLRAEPWWLQRITGVRLVGHALTQFVAPVELQHLYGPGVFATRPWLDVKLVAGALTLAGLGVVAWRLRRERPWASLCAVVTLLTLGAVCSVEANYSVMYAERLLYFGSAFTAALTAYGFSRLATRVSPRAVSALAAVWMLSLAALTAARAADWHDDESFWTASVETSPDAPVGLTALGVFKLRDGDLRAALALCTAATQRKGDYARAWGCSAMVRARIGDLDGAERDFQRMAQGDPDNAGFEANYARLLLMRGRPADALARLALMRRRARWTRDADALEAAARQQLAAGGNR